MAYTYAFAAPITSGQTDACRRFIAELSGPRQAEFADMQRRSGVTEETYWLQESPDGDLMIVVSDSDQRAFNELMVNPQTDFDRWFREQVQPILGGDPAAFGDVPPPPTPLLEWRAS